MLLSSAGGALFYNKKWDVLTCGFQHYDLLKNIITPHKYIEIIYPPWNLNKLIKIRWERERTWEIKGLTTCYL